MVAPVQCVSARMLPRASFCWLVLQAAAVVGWGVGCMALTVAGPSVVVGLVV